MSDLPLGLSTALISAGAMLAGIIIVVLIVRAVKTAGKKGETAAEAAESAVTAAPAPIPNRGELAAVVASCIAETMGRDVAGLRIASIKRVG